LPSSLAGETAGSIYSKFKALSEKLDEYDTQHGLEVGSTYETFFGTLSDELQAGHSTNTSVLSAVLTLPKEIVMSTALDVSLRDFVNFVKGLGVNLSVYAYLNSANFIGYMSEGESYIINVDNDRHFTIITKQLGDEYIVDDKWRNADGVPTIYSADQLKILLAGGIAMTVSGNLTWYYDKNADPIYAMGYDELLQSGGISITPTQQHGISIIFGPSSVSAEVSNLRGDILPKYNTVIDGLVLETGESREVVFARLEAQRAATQALDVAGSLAKNTTFHNALGVLSSIYLSGSGSLSNCASDVLSKTIGNSLPAGELLLELIATDLAAGRIAKTDPVNPSESRLLTSMFTMKDLLRNHGVEAYGYSLSYADFNDYLQPGQIAIIWVSNEHYIHVSKLYDSNNYAVYDTNWGSQALEFTATEFNYLLTNQNATAVNGTLKSGYDGVFDGSGMKVLTTSYALSMVGQLIPDSALKTIFGAHRFGAQ
jgi:hypothetical protein